MKKAKMNSLSDAHIFNYVYRVTHLQSGTHYIGSRKSRGLSPREDLGRRYFTSSKKVRPMFQKTPEAFRIKIVSVHKTYRGAFYAEQKYINRVRALEMPHKFFNRRYFCKGALGPEVEAKRQEARLQLAQDPEWKRRNSISHKGHTVSQETREKLRRAMIGNARSRNMSAEARRKISEAQRARWARYRESQNA